MVSVTSDADTKVRLLSLGFIWISALAGEYADILLCVGDAGSQDALDGALAFSHRAK